MRVTMPVTFKPSRNGKTCGKDCPVLDVTYRYCYLKPVLAGDTLERNDDGNIETTPFCKKMQKLAKKQAEDRKKAKENA